MITLGKYNLKRFSDLDIIRYAIEDQVFELDSGYITVNRWSDGIQIRYSHHDHQKLHKKAQIYFYDKNDEYTPVIRRRFMRPPRLQPLTPKIIGRDNRHRVVVIRIEPDTSQLKIMNSRKSMFDLARKISPYWA